MLRGRTAQAMFQEQQVDMIEEESGRALGERTGRVLGEIITRAEGETGLWSPDLLLSTRSHFWYHHCLPWAPNA